MNIKIAMKRIFCLVLVLSTLLGSNASALSAPQSPALPVSAPSAVLMERETGQIIFQREARSRLSPASVTKIMTLLLIAEALERGSIKLDGIVTASERAASFGGSCVYLETGEQMTVSDMIKCIAVVSANDCAVAMAEYLAGSEENFVAMMNERAQQLGLEDTHFTNCTGLADDDEHYTSAYDVAIMSRELLRHTLIKRYTTIWMDSIRGGEFELSNTNKLVYWYPGCTGLKTGYTSAAKYCLSATAERDGVEYIAVVMHCDTLEGRNKDAEIMLDYAFANYTLCPLYGGEKLPGVSVDMGEERTVGTSCPGSQYVLVPRNAGEPQYSIDLPAAVRAPVEAGQRLGTLTVSMGGKTVAEVPICAAASVERRSFFGIVRLLAGTLAGLYRI